MFRKPRCKPDNLPFRSPSAGPFERVTSSIFSLELQLETVDLLRLGWRAVPRFLLPERIFVELPERVDKEGGPPYSHYPTKE